LLKKLYKQEYGCDPPSPKALDTAAPEAPSAPSKSPAEPAKAKEDAKSEISDNYDDDWGDDDPKPKNEKKAEPDKKGVKK